MEVNQEMTKKSQRDCLLIREALENNNQQAYAELMEYYREAIYLMMLKMVNNPYDAEDLTIEAFGKAFRNLSQYTDSNAFSTWLFKIASNNCIDFLRKKRLNLVMLDQSYENEEGDPITMDIQDSMPNPEEYLCDKEHKASMRKVVAKLKPHYRQLIELRYFEELSYDEIATRMQLPLGTVKAKLFRAKHMLQSILKNKNI
ncbi:MAG TPA: sigma-70 family RNA polymerase sigma factor [Bacteroidales bacterium]|jgi:RNA polymerase sigma factor (sigma-70 family)|nr:sigma-70 family RNA polymerase sigma factor [Bacteroidales bacterium]HOF15355.1 sigma-70 family RNA polymerase sigma factor [Bacteroidales bacterium]HOR81119.1 sigma-70 family RNA polymerase sigma factor [Bacteroidales bacterium]HPJ90759.1 sigma-70 family RNA polymerase sigma factor [Bacteroidales bacterium]HPX59164.1 sigma-70 family RNA polymerase sigma factor [Bacteroidales bacterium]